MVALWLDWDYIALLKGLSPPQLQNSVLRFKIDGNYQFMTRKIVYSDRPLDLGSKGSINLPLLMTRSLHGQANMTRNPDHVPRISPPGP